MKEKYPDCEWISQESVMVSQLFKNVKSNEKHAFFKNELHVGLKLEIELMVNSLKPLDQNFYPIYPLTSKRGYYQKEIAIVYYQKEIAILYIIINYCI